MICSYCKGGSHGSCINFYSYFGGKAREKKQTPTNGCVCQHKSDRPWVSKYAVPESEGAK